MELAQTCDKKKRSQHCRVSTTVDRRGGRRPRNTWKRDLVNRGTWAGGRWTRQHKTDKKLISRWDSERELFYDDIVHALQNTIDSCRNSATDRRGYVLERRFTKFSEITQYNGHYAVQDHSRSPSLVSIKLICDFLLVINTNFSWRKWTRQHKTEKNRDMWSVAHAKA